ncbi:competence protein CoiA family protein [Georgenia yuyongxinii]
MTAKVSVAGLRFFAHYRRPQHCASAGETVEHQALKHRIAALIRECGGTADVEATPDVNDVGGWRADVLATTSAGRRVAFEIQLSRMSLAEGRARTERYAVDGIATVWLTTKHAHWVTALPSGRLRHSPDNELLIDRGLAHLGIEGWEPAGQVAATRLVAGVLDGRITTATQINFREDVDGRVFTTPVAVLLVGVTDKANHPAVADRAAEARRVRERAEAAEAAAEVTERERIEADRARLAAARRQADRESRLEQERLAADRRQADRERWLGQYRAVNAALADARAAGIPVDRIRLGKKWSRWDGEPVDLDRLVWVNGTRIWVAPAAGIDAPLKLWAIVDPPPSIASDLGKRWHAEGVRVYAASDDQAHDLAALMGWEPTNIRVIERATSRSGTR